MSRRQFSPTRHSAGKDRKPAPSPTHALLTQAISEHQAGHLEQAQQLYLQILALDVKHAKSLYGLGLIAQQTGNSEAAVRMLLRAVAINPQEPTYHSTLAAVLREQRKLDEALAEYRNVLALKPDDEEAHFLLGNILLDQGMSLKNLLKLDEAKAHFDRALVLKPKNADTHNNLGLIHMHRGEPEKAQTHYEQALRLNPDFSEAHNNLGNVFRYQKKLDEAAEHYSRALTLQPDYAGAYNNLGLILQKQGKLDAAKLHLQRALAINPKLAEAYNNLGTTLRDQGNLDEARDSYARAVALKPDYAAAHTNLGIILLQLGQLEKAVTAHEHAIALTPDFAEAHNNLGVALRELGKLDESVIANEKALALQPDFPEAHNNLGVARRDQGRLEEAEACYDKALALWPDFTEALCNKGIALKNRGSLKESRECHERAMILRPDSTEPLWNRCLLDLLGGNYSDGWRDYEIRHRRKESKLRKFSASFWRGEPLHGARILLHAEQGLGDSLQFLRYVPMVQAAGGLVLLDVPPGLRRLAAELPGLTALTTTGEPLGHFEWHCPLMSLPLAFGTQVDSIPARVPYLTAPEEAIRAADKLAWPDRGLRVGLVWSGNPKYSDDLIRSIPRHLIPSLLEVQSACFFSLQLGAAASQVNVPQTVLIDLQSAITDMADTAALLRHLDLVIAVDTAVAHLSGALGKPTWVLLPFVPDWRWLMDRNDSPWYPTARLFRQPRFGDWHSVVQQVRSELVALAEARHPQNGSI
ncbi:MAG TPA: tetratricopeptide repeat protein [Terracidiphilus sp.]|jgi:tetratricopeptide (TPR) repeat protein|nr:tetratricopeptide repeat protein [Terracidiphilus sp.]